MAVVIYRDAERRGIYLALFTDPEGDSCFSIYQISWIKRKKWLFVNQKRRLVGTLFTIYKHFGDFVKCILMILLQIQHEKNFLPTSKHRQAKVRRFLGICLNDCFIYCSNFVFRKCLETRRHLGRDPFNQNFRKFRSKTRWISSVQPEKFRKKWSTFWGVPLFPVGPVWILVEWIAPLGSGSKTVNSQGYYELREPIKTRENFYSLIW